MTSQKEVKDEKALIESANAVTKNLSMYADASQFEFAKRIGHMFATSDLVPDHFRDKDQNCIIALEMAARMEVSPFMLMQNLYVVHGKPGLEGKFVLSLVNQSGRFGPIKYEVVENGELTDLDIDRPDKVRAYAMDLKSGEIIYGPWVSWKMAVAEGWTKSKGDLTSKWQTLPDLMFRYRAATFFARTNCPEVLMGMQTHDELVDIELTRRPDGSYGQQNDPISIDDVINDSTVETEEPTKGKRPKKTGPQPKDEKEVDEKDGLDLFNKGGLGQDKD